MPVLGLLLLNLLLFGIGLAIVLTKRSIIFMVIGLELILQAAMSNCIVFDRQFPMQIQGQVLVIFSTVIAACEIVLVLAMSLRLYQCYKTTDFNQLR